MRKMSAGLLAATVVMLGWTSGCMIPPTTNRAYAATTSANSSGDSNNLVYYKNRVVVVTFHDMSKTLDSSYNMMPNQFDADLSALQLYHFHVIGNHTFTNWLSHRGSIPSNAVLLTFDDGYQSMFTTALPALLHHHMSGTFFDIVYRPDVHSSGFISWPELKTMTKDGMSIESHTYDSHYRVKWDNRKYPVFDVPVDAKGQKETQVQYFQRDYNDFSRARKELQQHLRSTVDEFAWPYGWGSRTALRAAVKAGYQYIFTTAKGSVTRSTNPHAIPRIDIGKPSISPTRAVQDILRAAGTSVRVKSLVPAIVTWSNTSICIDGQSIFKNAPGFTTGNRFFISAYDAVQLFKKLGIKTKWYQNKLEITAASFDTTKIPVSRWGDAEIEIDGTKVMTLRHIVLTPPKGLRPTSFLPLSDLKQVLEAFGYANTYGAGPKIWNVTYPIV